MPGWPRPRAAPPRLPSAQRIVAALLGLGLVAVIAGALAGWWTGGKAAAPPAPPPDAPRAASAGPVHFEVDSHWVPIPRVPGLTGLPAAAAAFTPAASLRAYAVVTVSPADHSSLLPAALRAIMPARLPAPKTTELLGLPAWRYGELGVSEGRLMEVTLVPSTAGTLAITCIAPRESWVAALGCAGDVRKLSLPAGASWLPPAADVAARERIPEVVSKLDGERVQLRARLKAARLRRGQARFAGRLAKAYAAAAAALAGVAPAKGAAAAVVADLRRSSASYGGLSAAAAAGQRLRYERASRAAKRNEAALKASLAALDESP